MSCRDFDPGTPNASKLTANFELPLGNEFSDNLTKEMIDFAARAKGPFHIFQERITEYAASGMVEKGVRLCAAILHPDDRVTFAAQFLPQGWQEKPGGVEANAIILGQQADKNRHYDDRRMFQFLKQIKTLGHPPTAKDIDGLLWKLCPEEAQPRSSWLAPHRLLPALSRVGAVLWDLGLQ
jgi:hypothetical protein